MSRFPPGDQYASAFWPPRVSWLILDSRSPHASGTSKTKRKMRMNVVELSLYIVLQGTRRVKAVSRGSWLLVLLSSPCFDVHAELRLAGRVSNTNNVPVAGAKVAVQQPGYDARLQTMTDPSGTFTVTLPGTGDYRFTVEREGFFQVKDRLITV